MQNLLHSIWVYTFSQITGLEGFQYTKGLEWAS